MPKTMTTEMPTFEKVLCPAAANTLKRLMDLVSELDDFQVSDHMFGQLLESTGKDDSYQRFMHEMDELEVMLSRMLTANGWIRDQDSGEWIQKQQDNPHGGGLNGTIPTDVH